MLRAAALLAPPDVHITQYDSLDSLPHFSPDREDPLPEPVVDWRRHIGEADGLLISTPEYAHGLPGSFKNALDWLVSGPEFVYKPIAVLQTAGRGAHAQASLLEILRTMSGRIVAEACRTVPLKRTMTDTEIAAEPSIADALRSGIESLVNATRNPIDGLPDRPSRIEHVGLWVRDLEVSRAFYERWFGATAGSKYQSVSRPFSSYFLTLASGARLELMHLPGEAPRPAHIAYTPGGRAEVDALVAGMQAAGVPLLGPTRVSGDGYYEAVVADPDGNPVEVVADVQP